MKGAVILAALAIGVAGLLVPATAQENDDELTPEELREQFREEIKPILEEMRDLFAQLRDLAREDPQVEELKDRIGDLRSQLRELWQEYRAALAELLENEGVRPPKARRGRGKTVPRGRGRRRR